MIARTRNLIGPELLWILLYLAAALLARANQPPTVAGNQRLEQIAWVLPIVGVVISFLPFRWVTHPWWCLARNVGFGLIGVVMVTTELCSAMHYNDSRDSGVGMGWVLFISLGWERCSWAASWLPLSC